MDKICGYDVLRNPFDDSPYTYTTLNDTVFNDAVNQNIASSAYSSLIDSATTAVATTKAWSNSNVFSDRAVSDSIHNIPKYYIKKENVKIIKEDKKMAKSESNFKKWSDITVEDARSLDIFKVKTIHHSGPVTVVRWEDNTVTVVRLTDGAQNDPYAAFCIALAKKLYGNNTQIKKIIKEKTIVKKSKDQKKAE